MKHELFTLKNVGKATFEDLMVLNIHSIAELAKANPDELYSRLQRVTKRKHDPCVWDVFGEKQAWWEWTKVRKARKQQ